MATKMPARDIKNTISIIKMVIRQDVRESYHETMIRRCTGLLFNCMAFCLIASNLFL